MSNARFSILQARAISDERISDAQFRTLAALGMYADKNGWCWPSLTRIGADCNKRKQAAGRDIIALKKLGYVESYPQFNEDGSRKVNKYRLVFDTPVNKEGYTPSTSEVDTPSTSEVDVNAPINAPINNSANAETIIRKANKKVDEILALQAKSEERIAEGKGWKGRELVRADLLVFADWYHQATGQSMTKRVQSSWYKALSVWKDEELEVQDLQAAFEKAKAWKVVSDPNQLTADAVALRAERIIKQPAAQRTESSGYYA